MCDAPTMHLYSGEWKNGKPHGNGKSYRANGTLEFDGVWEHGERSNGTVFYPYFGTVLYKGSFENNAYHGKGTLYRTDGTLSYAGEFKNGDWYGVGVEYASDGTVLQEGIFVHGKYDMRATKIKRKRERASTSARKRIAESHRVSPHVGEVPTCVLCFDALHHGDASFVYVPCGHRVLCGACEATLESAWRTKCPCCKGAATHLVRVF